MRPMPDRECGNRTTIIPSPTEWRTGWRLMWGMHRKGRPQGRVALIVAGELQPVLVKLETADHDRQSSEVKKCSLTGKRHANNCSCRSTRGPGRGKSVSFPAVRAQFSALSVEDQLQFLSWLFEGALSHCVSTRANTDAASISRSIPSQDVDISYDYPSSNTELDDTQSTPTRKGLPWSAEEKIPWKKQRVHTGVLEHDAQETAAIFGGRHVENAILIDT
ncbi:hypothetical protein PCH_Pc17g00270 [Penicillium rubens Wisconsin 54-1255]|uniref:Uncharacterized protein n=1 Tax=Penicillium rubens (strain ATCC 28089 / DSM 1075 / NRRL 1951 / Wisconsin 54-1255) TaxID=500485 RepID=B6HAV9_PENRW|nr:hypothetical protein PCH_Pc17g00270 [Penicillium rubens Wisconsin 54-1255]